MVVSPCWGCKLLGNMRLINSEEKSVTVLALFYFVVFDVHPYNIINLKIHRKLSRTIKTLLHSLSKEKILHPLREQ